MGDRCRCPPGAIARYRERISGPLRDRFDIAVDVRPVDPEELLVAPDLDGVREQAGGIAQAVEAQRRRGLRLGLDRPWNSRLPGRLLPRAAEPSEDAEQELVLAARRHGLTGRGVHRVLRVARTVADLAGHGTIQPKDVHHALTLRVGT